MTCCGRMVSSGAVARVYLCPALEQVGGDVMKDHETRPFLQGLITVSNLVSNYKLAYHPPTYV